MFVKANKIREYMTRYIAIAIWLLFVLQMVVSAASLSEDFKLQGETARVFEEMIRSPYNPETIERGDSLCREGRRHQDVGEMGAGLFVKANAYRGVGELEKSDSTFTIVEELIGAKEEYEGALGIVYTYYISVKISIDDYKDAERLASKLIETAQKTGNTEMIAAGYYNLGAIYQATQNIATGLQMHKKAVDIAEANGHKREMVNGYLQMAYCYEWLEEKEECERAIDRAIEICTQANAQTYVNALLAHKLSFKCLEISDKEYIETFERLRNECSIEDIVGQDAYWWMLANYYAAKGDRARALEYADSIEDETNRKWARQCVYIRLKDWESAYKFGEMMVEWQDSVKAITQSETMAEKDAELNNVKLRLEKAELETHNRIILFGSLGAIVLLIVGVVIVNGIAKRRRLQEQKRLLEEEVKRKTAELVKKNKELEDQKEEIATQNEKLERQNVELEAQKEEIEVQNEQLEKQNDIISQINKDLTDSINYASTIQASILPDLRTYVHEGGIAGVFTILIPYKIVSGDFYWAREQGDCQIFVCADCTGHGVPGALMSMIGSTLLTDISNVEQMLRAGQILEELDKRLKYQLSQSNGKDSKDGMDISIAVYKPETRSLQIASARRPVYIRQGGELREIKGTKRSIGERDIVICTAEFETVEVSVSKGDTLYMCSDGIADQFGGKEQNGGVEKRLKNSGVRQWIEDVKGLSIEEQGIEIHSRIVGWKKDSEQVDDISMVGIEF